MNTKLFKQRGFTIVELVVAISVIGVIASIVLVSYIGTQNRSIRSSHDATAQQAKLKLSEYFTDNGRYPENGFAVLQYFTDSGSGELRKTIEDSGAYDYVATTSGGGGCNEMSRNCQTYTITVSASNWSGQSSDNIIVRP